MKSFFSKIGSSIHKNPFKLLFVSIIVIIGMIAGATNMNMSTGNDTLVKSDNSIYIETKKMESTFGGDSILVLIESEDENNLLNVENMQLLYDIQQRLENEEDIFSIMSPATIINQVSKKQSEMLIDNVVNMSVGLNKMGDSLTDIGEMLLSTGLINPEEMVAKINNLSDLTIKFEQLSSGQRQLDSGLKSIEENLTQVSAGVINLSNQISQIAADVPEEEAKLLLAISNQIKQTAIGLEAMGGNTKSMQEAANGTANAIDNISNNLDKEFTSIKESFTSSISPDSLNKMAEGFLEMGVQLNSLSDGLNMISDKSPMMEATVVSTQDELDSILFNEDGGLNSMLDDVVISPHQMLMLIKLQGNLDDQRKDELTSYISGIFEGVDFENAQTTISGKSVLDLSLKSEMKSSMMMMVLLAVLIMFIILGLIFKVKWRMLSLGVIFFSVLATLGFMGWISIPITMVSMAAFPILIGLGIDYSIQFHNRFEEEDDIEKTSKHIGKAVFIAVIATMLGFISLYASPVPMIQDFGKMLTIGVFISFLGSLFLLLPILRAAQFVQDKSKAEKYKSKDTPESFMHRFMAKGARITVKFRYIILSVFLLSACYGIYVDSRIPVETNIETFMPQDLQALDDIKKVRGAIESTDQIVVYFEDDNVLSEKNYIYMKDKATLISDKYTNEVVSVKSINQLVMKGNNTDALEIAGQIEYVDTIPDSQRKMFISANSEEAIMILQIKPLSTQELEELITGLKSDFADSDMSTSLTGKSMLDVEMVGGLTDGRVKMTLIGLGLVFLALLLIYRHLIKALLPIIPVVIIIGISSAFMYLLKVDWTPITATLGALVLGMGTEMTIMMMERYIEDRQKGNDKISSIEQAVAKIGKAILASGLTTIGGFSVLIFSSFVILKDFGLMTMINISLALISTFLVLPPLLYIFDGLIIKKKSIQE